MLGNLMTVLLTCLLVTGLLVIAPAVNATAIGRSLLSRLQPSRLGSGQSRQGSAGLLIAAVAAFLLVVGIGAATSYFPDRSEVAGPSHSGSSDDPIARLKDYTRTMGTEDGTSKAAAGKPLPDVNTMIDRLAARLKTAPDDAKGWRMLGWSYFHTARYKEAVSALARAIELDPSSDELKRAYEEAKTKVSESDSSETAPPLQAAAPAKSLSAPSAEQVAAYAAMPAHEREAAIRSMVDALSDRLDSAPRDVDGWTRLMRSRVVLGERDRAATAFRKALDVFKDDMAASGRIAAAATELGLKSE